MCKPNYGGIVLLPLLLASCIGGNFGVQPVVESTPTAPTLSDSKSSNPADKPAPAPAEPSVETTPVNRPAVGAAMRLSRRNIATFDKNGNEIPDSKQAEEYLPLKEEDILFLDGTPQEQADKLKKKINERYPDVKVITSTNEDAKYNYRFVRAGYVFTRGGGYDNEKEKTPDGKEFVNRFSYDGFVYYSGEHPSQSLPRTETVQYSGNWQFVTDAKRWRTQNDGGGVNLGFNHFYGNDIGATSYAVRDADDREKHPAKYTVDFDKKILKGELIKNQYVRNRNGPQNPLTIYNITAKLDGNRFTGSASVNPDLAKNHTNKEHLFFHANADQRLEGGFFGDKGEELAGRFISNDNSVFGVFAGKQKTEASGTNPAMPSGKHTKILDSLKISVDEATDKNARQFAISSMPDLGHPDKLLVEGREIPLVNQEQIINLADGRKMTVRACCDFLTYVKLGRIKTDRPASKPKAEDKGKDEEDTGVGNDEEGTEDEAAEGSEGGEDEIGDEGGSAEDEAVEDEGSEEDEGEEAEEPEEESPAEGGSGSGGIPPAPEAPKGRDIDLFLKGIRTAEADIPKTGKAHYTGTWEARISKPIQWDNHADKAAKAEFTVDFGEKSISGKLTEKNGVEPAFHIENGKIEGNGFHATAHTRESGIDLSGQGSTKPQIFKADNLLVTGGFYGPQAAELGGTIFNNDGKSLGITEDAENEAEAEAEAGVDEQLKPEVKPQFGVVFGAKKDNKEVEK
ncbi:transferrin-binding protein-like solute binding protein [Neisseria meningitidis]|uniref:transferrin-binding protein-like solute binding protein n=1 Tax=Neisseria meningitidis TaxID=487 RepID=UPI001EE0CF95|nr:transferrin-binding protein-like solute binding protein [Neisseria meningitidis]MCG3352607.1 transferrin-binding protein-like solute binding protein [Neisseria meningitidis]MCG3356668.1 transferrin-binding protein-like solute binding protein [Neisseria meningitidis]